MGMLAGWPWGEIARGIALGVGIAGAWLGMIALVISLPGRRGSHFERLANISRTRHEGGKA